MHFISLSQSLYISESDLRLIEKSPNSVKSFECLQAVMKKMLFYYKYPDNQCWSEDPEVHLFPCGIYWNIIETTVASIVIQQSNITELCQKYQHVIKALSRLHSQVVELGQLNAPLWKAYQPAQKYLTWVKDVIQAIEALEKKINTNEWTKDFMEKFISVEASVTEVAQCVHTNLAISSPKELLGEMRRARVRVVETVLKRSDTDNWLVSNSYIAPWVNWIKSTHYTLSQIFLSESVYLSSAHAS